MGKHNHDSGNPRCSFCGKPKDQMKRLIAGPGVLICNQSYALRNEVIDEDSRPSPPTGARTWTRVTNSAARQRRASFMRWLRNLLRSRALQHA